jgi:hypothetical protein
MKFRDVAIFSGHRFTVPQCIQRIDHGSTHGWQVRYQGTKLFSDGTPDGTGAAASLQRAIRELMARIASLPAPVLLQRAPSAHKTTDLPPGISGPIVRARRHSNLRSASFSVLIPRYGQRLRITSVYIGNENTYSADRYREALAKALMLREAAERQYVEAATEARRKELAILRAALKAMRGGEA